MNEIARGTPVLLIRPKPVDNEDIPEYLQRLAKANALNSLSELTTIFKASLDQLAIAGHAKLQAVLQGRETLLSPFHSLQAARQTNSRLSRYARVCISCLKESDVLKGCWNAPLAISCRKHNERLLDHCPACHRLILRENSQYRCICGRPFSEFEPQVSANWEYKFNELFSPWHNSTRYDKCWSKFQRHETNSSIYIRKTITRSKTNFCLEDNKQSKNRLYSNNFELLEHLLSNKTDLAQHLSDFQLLSAEFLSKWHKLPSLDEKLAPKIIPLLDRALHSESNFSTVNRRSEQIKIDKSFDVSNISRLLKISKAASIELFESTYSISEIAHFIGIPSGWHSRFWRKAPEVIQITPRRPHTWRIQKSVIEPIVRNFNKCREDSLPTENYPEGYFRIKDITNKAFSLQQNIQNKLIQGELILAYEQAFPPRKLIDFSIPLRNFKNDYFSRLLSKILSLAMPAIGSR